MGIAGAKALRWWELVTHKNCDPVSSAGAFITPCIFLEGRGSTTPSSLDTWLVFDE